MNLAAEIEASWALLRPSRLGSGSVESRRIPGDVWRSSMLALDDEGRRHLLIPVDDGVPIQEDRRAAGVHVVEHGLLEHGKTRRFVDVYCRKPHLDELFTTIVVEVLERLETGTPADAAATQALERWRELLSTEAGRIPSVRLLIGVYGELLALHELLVRNHTLSSAWVGSGGARHDLLTATGAIEAKTTLTRTGWSVEIHGLDQLDPPAAGPLALAVMRVEQHPSEGSSIPDLVDELVRLGGDRVAIMTGLVQRGVSPEILEAIRPLHFAERERRWYRVEASFPRLSTTMLKTGLVPAEIVDVNYRLDLNAVPDLPEAAVEAMLMEIAG